MKEFGTANQKWCGNSHFKENIYFRIVSIGFGWYHSSFRYRHSEMNNPLHALLKLQFSAK